MGDDIQVYEEMLAFLEDEGHERYWRSAVGLLKAHARLLDEVIRLRAGNGKR